MTQKPWFLPLLIFLAIACLMVATAPLVPDTFGDRFSSVDDLDRPLIPELLARAAQNGAPKFLPQVARYRFFACVLFAAAATGLFIRMRSRYPTSVAWIALLGLLTMPREFAAAHTATDSAMAASCVILSWALFPIACRGLIGLTWWLAAVSLGVVLDFRVFVLVPFTAVGLFGDGSQKTRSEAGRVLMAGLLCMIALPYLIQAVLRYDPDFVRSGFRFDFVSRFKFDLHGLSVELLSCPDWQLFFAVFGFWSAFRHYRQDPERPALAILAIVVALVLDGPARLVFIAPIAALGAGRMLYRGTLTKSFRIPPPTWAIILVTIAAIRSAVIMITRAPHWDEYVNRIGIWLGG